MDELRELYQQVIIDHAKRPRNFRELPAPDRKAEGYNPLCGDRLTVSVTLQGDTVADVAFVGDGCAISRATASLMTEAVRGKSMAEAEALFAAFRALVTGEPGEPGEPAKGPADEPAEPAKDHAGPAKDASTAPPVELGKLTVLAGVREFPMRVKCATLAWHTLHAALSEQTTATTE